MSYRLWSKKLSKHKAVDVDWNGPDLRRVRPPIRTVLLFDFQWSRKTDHAGISFSIGLLGAYVSVQFYDTRHWDHDNERWESYE